LQQHVYGLIGFFLALFTMRHVQEHATQLSHFLGQHAIPDGRFTEWASEMRKISQNILLRMD